PARGEDLALVLDRHQELFVGAHRLAIERHVRDQRGLAARVGELLDRGEHLLALAGHLVDLDDVLDVVEWYLEEAREVDLPLLVLVLEERGLGLLADLGVERREALRRGGGTRVAEHDAAGKGRVRLVVLVRRRGGGEQQQGNQGQQDAAGAHRTSMLTEPARWVTPDFDRAGQRSVDASKARIASRPAR